MWKVKTENNSIENSDDENSGGLRRRQQKIRTDAESDDRLEDDDYDLLEENLGVKV